VTAPWVVETAAPADPSALRQALYRGRVFLLPASAATLRIVARAREMLVEAFADLGLDPREAPQHIDNDALFARIGKLRKALYTEPQFHQAMAEVADAHGFPRAEAAFDPLRLRVIVHRGHHNPLAAPVYYPHRDTWYGHPQTLVTGWIPLDDLAEAETFVFHPRWFDQEVPNDSETFEYGAWARDKGQLKVGWQDIGASQRVRYPGLIGDFDPGERIGFSCARGQLLLFSGAHFHTTRPQETGRTRYSLDFRVVHLGDTQAGLGAPNVDARGRGSALVDYVRL
jgi:hypothetical protein